MKALFGFVGILMVLGIGYFIYSTQLESGPNDVTLPQAKNLIAVRQDLLSLGQSQRLYMAANGTYATLDQLRSSSVVGNLPGTGRPGYEYSIELQGTRNFIITARPVDPARGLPTMTVDKTMQVSEY